MPALKNGWGIPAIIARRAIFSALPATGTWPTCVRTIEKQVAMGLKNVRLVEGSEIRGMFPLLRGDDIVGGSFSSTDGFVDPYSAMVGLMTWATDHGARLRKNSTVTGIGRDERGIASVETTAGAISTRKLSTVPAPGLREWRS